MIYLLINIITRLN